jgi:hypothetical protein
MGGRRRVQKAGSACQSATVVAPAAQLGRLAHGGRLAVAVADLQRYRRPSRSTGWRTYWNSGTTRYTGGPWHSYAQVPALTMINYIDGKLAGVPVAQRDGDYAAPAVALDNLRLAYSPALAGELLSRIKAKGWWRVPYQR